MTPPKKPDWMEIADNDGGLNNSYPKVKKSRPVLIAATALVLTFGGAVVAQTNQGGSAQGQQPLLIQASQSAAIATPVTKVLETKVPVTTVSVNTAAAIKRVVPAIATPPSANDDDDNDDDDDDDDDNDDDNDDDAD